VDPGVPIGKIPHTLPFDPPGFGCDFEKGELIALEATCSVTIIDPNAPVPPPRA